LRSFEQSDKPSKICANINETINLLDFINFIDFTTEKERGSTTTDVNFIYDNEFFVNWRLVSGDSSLKLLSQPDNLKEFDPKIDYALGTINTYLKKPGIYTFEYGVSPKIRSDGSDLCNPFSTETSGLNFCEDICNTATTLISIEILAFDYAGEDTTNIEVCESLDSIILTSLLKTDPLIGTINPTGVWTDPDGAIIDNIFTINKADVNKTFSLTYTTTNLKGGCMDKAQLDFKIIEENNNPAGEGKTVTICSNNLNITLFDQLTKSPEPTGVWTGPEGYVSRSHLGQFVLSDRSRSTLKPGEYTYTVNNPLSCSITDTAVIIIAFVDPIILAEDTIERNFCKVEGSIDLKKLLSSAIDKSGTFKELDSSGALTGSIVSFETLSIAIYNFEYTLPKTGECEPPKITIKITLLDEVKAGFAGDDNSIRVCSNELSLKLFEQLKGEPVTTGKWSSPFGYTSTDHIGAFSATNPSIQRLAEGVYTYTVGGGKCSTSEDTATVSIEFTNPIEVGKDLNITRCKSDGSLNLFSLLDNTTTRSGTFLDLNETKALNEEGRLDFALLSNKTYNFKYSVKNSSPCNPSILNIELKIVDLELPIAPETNFCILDAKRLNDIEVTIPNFNWYTSFDSELPIKENLILFDDTTLYLSNVDSENCESERIAVPIKILNIGEKIVLKDDSGNVTARIECPLDFQDGVTPNNDNQNDSFSLVKENLFNIPEAFPEFNLEIFNRFGTLVFKGNRNTEEFRGENNVNLSIGNELPSGVYFYVFTPNFKNNAPIQGSFYLSK